ncbi:MAG: metallophosphoesterase family protein [Acidobacteria bacterium]|nr:metallophosphoesterase family protein [Acidobacteriota bacterium]
MRILLLSDIHSNLEALDACLASAPAYDRAINLGDIVGYGASPNEVTERVRDLGKVFVRGNHDKAVSGMMTLDDFNPVAGLAALWTRDQLKPQNLDWLRGLPEGPVFVEDLPQLQFVHGSPLDEDEYVVSLPDAIAPMLSSAAPITFFGHTHLQGSFSTNGGGSDFYRPEYRTVGQAEISQFPLKEGTRYMVNPGSVGQPRDGDWRAAFASYDTQTRIVTFHRVPYNLKGAQERILAANLPPKLATRLAAGR